MDSVVAARPLVYLTGSSAKQAEVLVDPTLLFLLGQLAFGIKFA
jgi:hypothetical protein